MNHRRIAIGGGTFAAGALAVALVLLPGSQQPAAPAQPAYVGDYRSGKAAYWVGTQPNTVACDRIPVVVLPECDPKPLIPAGG